MLSLLLDPFGVSLPRVGVTRSMSLAAVRVTGPEIARVIITTVFSITHAHAEPLALPALALALLALVLPLLALTCFIVPSGLLPGRSAMGGGAFLKPVRG